MFEFNHEYEGLLKEAFHHFVEGTPFDYSGVRSDIYQSWIRSKEYNIAYDTPGKLVCKDDKETKKLIKDNGLLLEVARKHLTKIYDVIRPSGYYIFISDKNGWLLDIISDTDLLSNYEHDPTLVIGASRHERYAGTNAIGTCLLEGKPMVFWGEEHYNLVHKKYTCAGAPIRDNEGNILGCISITGRKEDYQGHTLGIVISTVAVIESELKQICNKGKSNRTEYTFDHFIGECEEMKKLKDMARQVAKTDAPILLWGESGSGKEVLAHAIHNESSRASGPFVAINCGAIPRELIESELFGYEAGAFTGARKEGKSGTLEAASGGTLFLDEVESMPLDVQIKLLRVLSTYRVSRVGTVEEMPIDIRIISASKADLYAEADAGRFREDLYYRINTITLKIPPLRQRGQDIRILTDHYIKKLTGEQGLVEYGVPQELYGFLDQYSWRGNVRELRNVLEGIIAMTNEGELLNLSILPDRMRRERIQEELYGKPSKQKLKDFEIEAIQSELEKAGGNISAAAKSLGIARSTLYEKLKNNPQLRKYIKK